MNKVVNCPTCGKAVEWSDKNKWRPFCCERCRLIDLGAWADEEHCIRGEEIPSIIEDDIESNY